MGRSPGKLDELAGATRGFRAPPANEAKTRADRRKPRSCHRSSVNWLSLPEIVINARRTGAGVLAFKNIT